MEILGNTKKYFFPLELFKWILRDLAYSKHIAFSFSNGKIGKFGESTENSSCEKYIHCICMSELLFLKQGFIISECLA